VPAIVAPFARANVRDLRIAPEGARARLAAAINRPRKRAFGLFKTQDEFVGFVDAGRFEIWERQQRAVHARGEIRAKRGGTRIEARIGPAPRTWALVVVFFALYVILAGGLAAREPDQTISTGELAIAAAGAVTLGVFFFASALQQRRHLEAFLDAVFRDVPRV
jgi:hypothetical protein